MNALNTARVEILTPTIGARIEGVDLSEPLAEPDIAAIRQLFLTNRVIFFEDQNLLPQQHRDFAARFGEFQIHPFYQPHPEYPELVVLDTGAHNPTDNDHWHTDMTYSAEPPMAGILYSRLIPPQGGDTLWADMHAAYMALSGPLKALLDPLDAVHDLANAFRPDHRAVHASGSDQYEKKMQANPPVLHPVVRTHPETGEECLFVNEGFTTAICGLPKSESDDLLRFLFNHVQKPEFSVRWRWKPNTVAMWDNRITQHYAVNDYLPDRRIMHRATIKGSRPFNRSRPSPAN
ncbi:MAG TPA: taurine dioxygenase [Rhizomicrobium sp.]